MPEALRRILMTVDAVGGVWTYAVDLAREFSSLGIEVHLACLGPPPVAAQREVVERIPRAYLHVGQFRLEWMENPWDDVARSGEWLLGIERAIHPDLVHLNGYSHGVLPFRAPTVVAGHSCVLSWWRGVHGCEAPSSWNRYRDAVRAGLVAADDVLAPSKAMLDSLRRDYGITRGTVVHNGRPAPVASSTELPRENLVLGVGRLWDEAKNLASLARVAKRLERPGWTVALAGDVALPGGGDDQRAGGAEGRAAADFEGATLLGRLHAAALGVWYARAAIVALPARYEPFGLSALEAGLAGCALVLGDLPSQREVWGDAAVFVPPGDDEALADALRWLIDRPERRLALGLRARKRASGFTVRRMAEGTLDVHRAVVDRRSARCGS